MPTSSFEISSLAAFPSVGSFLHVGGIIDAGLSRILSCCWLLPTHWNRGTYDLLPISNRNIAKCAQQFVVTINPIIKDACNGMGNRETKVKKFIEILDRACILKTTFSVKFSG
jgi:hypothetical protein